MNPGSSDVEAELVTFLRRLAEEQHLIERALVGHLLWIKNDPDLLPSHIRAEEIRAEFRMQSLNFKNSLLSYPYIDTTVELFVKGERIGYYSLITMLDGTVDDDYFVINE